MFGKRAKKTKKIWFAFMLVVVLAGLPVVASAGPAAPARTGTDVLAAVHAWWQSWSGVLRPEAGTAVRRQAPVRRQIADPQPPEPRLGAGDGAVLRLSGEDSPKMDPDG